MSPSTGDALVRSLYKSASSCADHHAADFLKALHIPTPIDDVVLLATRSNKTVIVTGNPGDGKTHLIRKIKGDFPKKTVVNEDANQSDDLALIKELDKATSTKTPMVLAINEGILLRICEQARRKSTWAAPIINSLLHPYVYGIAEPDQGNAPELLDLNLRNNLSALIVVQAVERVAKLVKPNGPMSSNAQRLQHPHVKSQVVALLDAVGRTGFHATMRDVLGFAAYLLCGGEDENESNLPKPYYENAFSGGVGPLFEAVREHDPVRVPDPFLDDRLFACEDEDGDWHVVDLEERREREDLGSFRSRKRRAYFEHKSGVRLVRAARNSVDRAFDQLKRSDQSPECVAIQLLNRFFESRDTPSDQLTLWFSHQFSARHTRYVASRQFVLSTDLEVCLPRLPARVSNAFPDHYPDHVVFKHKQMNIGDGLVIDRRMLSMLIEGDRQTGLGTRSLEAQTKVAAFYDRLARCSTSAQPTIQILRLDTMNKVRVAVNVADATFYFPGG